MGALLIEGDDEVGHSLALRSLEGNRTLQISTEPRVYMVHTGSEYERV